MRFWTIARNDLRLSFKDKMFFFWLLVFPLLFAFVFGLAFPRESPSARPVIFGVADRDGSFLSRNLIEELKGERYDVREIGEGEERPTRTLVIPENFAADVLAGKKVELVLGQREESDREASQAAYSNVLKAVIKILAKIVILSPEPDQDLEQALPRYQLESLITVRPEMAGKLGEIPAGFDRMIPASAIMFVLFTVFMYGGFSILEERRTGLLERLAMSPATFASILGGKWLGRLMLAMLQVALLFAAGKLLFKTYLGTSLAAVFLVALFFGGTVAGISILLGSLIRKEEVMIVFNILLANLMAALGGCWIPLELFPPGLKAVGFIFPTGWAMDAFNKLIFFGYDLKSVALNIAVLALYMAAVFALSVRIFKLKKV
jgi:ABC-2 type transport system permease protein